MKKFYPFSKFIIIFLVLSLAIFSKPAYSQVNLWTWVSGDTMAFVNPVYGIKGIPSPTNSPGPGSIGYGTCSFVDTSGNFYYYQTGKPGNPLWRYNPSTNEWTWLHGDTTNSIASSVGVFGTQGVADPANMPSILGGSITWTDANNNLWLFGGGVDGSSHFNDLWKYNVATNQWTWMKGTGGIPDKKAVYGIKGVASSSNDPGGRKFAFSWTDAAGNLWFIGGSGVAVACCNPYGQATYGQTNEIWKYEIATGKWAWMAGDSSFSLTYIRPIVYGTLGAASTTTTPGCIYAGRPNWKDPSGNIWQFGTYYNGGINNAFWKFNTTSFEWTWVGGDTTIQNAGSYGQKGISSPSNLPPTRYSSMFWTDAAENFWLYGGQSDRSGYELNDLWKYNSTTKEWVWINGTNSYKFEPAYYGIKGSPYVLNTPGTREWGMTFKGKDGNFYLFGGQYNDPIVSYIYKADLWKMKPADYNTLGFNMFIDTNYNGIHEASEPYLRNAKASISYGTTSFSAASSTGKFTSLVDTGTYTIMPTLSVPYYNLIPTSHTTAFGNTYFHFDTFSFALQPIPGFKDVTIFVTPLTRVRLGRGMLYKIECYNPGTSTVSGTFNFIQDNKLLYDSASATPASITGDTLTWSYSNLKPLETRTVFAYFKVKTPPAANINDTIYCFANASPLPGESNITDNSASVTQPIRAPYDPNDKTENHGGKIALSKAVAGEYLEYTIRFQNTGNDTAFDIFVRDTLSSKLDWNTLEMISGSHNYQMTMNNGKCEWTFRTIHLVDSIHNEPQSHGYLTYRIKSKSNIGVGDVIKNSASIYFDFNLPIKTNTETTTVVADALPLKLLSFTAKKQGKTNLLNWTTAQEINVDKFEIERSNNSREFSKIGTVKAGNTSYTFTHNNPLKAINYYRLKMIDKDGQFTYSPIRSITINNSQLTIALFPNPAKDYLQVQIESDRETALTINIITQDGKVLKRSNISAAEGSSLRSINISALPKGSYLLKVNTSSNEEQVMKFEKL